MKLQRLQKRYSFLYELPDEIRMKIVKKLNTNDRLRLCEVCVSFNNQYIISQQIYEASYKVLGNVYQKYRDSINDKSYKNTTPNKIYSYLKHNTNYQGKLIVNVFNSLYLMHMHGNDDYYNMIAALLTSDFFQYECGNAKTLLKYLK